MTLIRQFALILIFILGLLFQFSWAIVDEDLDGMSSLWEVRNGFSPTDNGTLTPSQAPGADPDGDQVTNLLESIAGTNPLVAEGPLGVFQSKITPSSLSPVGLNLEWRQLVGKKYQIWKSPNLTANSWTPVGSPSIGTSPSAVFTSSITTSGAEKSFYKIAVSDVDQDFDNLSNHEESEIGTSPTNADSDSDEMQDGYEYQYGGIGGLNSGDDLDNDSLNNIAEYQIGTNPLSGDTDHDQTNDATEVEQQTSPTSSGDSGQVDSGKIRIRVVTGTFLGATYPYPAYPVYPINIFRRNLDTGAETLLHSVPTTEFFNARNIDLPNDGSAYSLQVALPTLGTGTFDQQFRDFSWFCQCIARVGSAPVVMIDRFDTTTNNFGTAGRLLGVPSQIYNPGFNDFRVLIIPVNVHYVTRDTDTGLVSRSNALVEGSDARPSVKITNISTLINPAGQLALTVSGTARDPMSEVLASGVGAVQNLAVYLNGDFVETMSNLTPLPGTAPIRSPWLRRDSTVAFTKTLLIDGVSPGMHNIRLFSNANALGQKGFDGASVLVEKVNYSPTPVTNPPPFSFTLPAMFTPGQDTLTIISGSESSVLSEDASAPNSGLFTGTLTMAGASRDIAIQVPVNIALDSGTPDRISTEITWKIGAQSLRISGLWQESTSSSLNFYAVSGSVFGTVDSSSNLVVSHIHNDPNITTPSLSPTALRLEVPSNFDFFGNAGLLTGDLNGTTATFHEHPLALPYGPPTGKKWFYYGTSAEPRIFTFNDILNGTAQSPSEIANAGTLDLTVKLRSTDAVAFKDTSVLRKLANFKDLQASSALRVPASSVDPFEAQSLNSTALPTYTMAEVRFWYAFLFDDVGENLLARYETGGTTSDAGLVISLQNFWSIDSRSYAFNYTSPYHQTSGGSDPRTPQLYLNRRNLATPVDAAMAVFTSLQELRSSSFLRTSLVVDHLELVDTYLSSDSYDPNVEQTLRQGRLAPIREVLTSAKSAFEFGFSLIPGGDLVVTTNFVDESVQNGNIKGAAVAGILLFTPEFVDRTFKYCKRRSINAAINLGPTANLTIAPSAMKELFETGIFTLGTQNRSLKMVAIKDMLERNAITREQVGMLYDIGYLHITPGRSREILGENLRAAGFNRIPPGSPAHHWLALAQGNNLEREFIIRGVDPNLAIHGEFMVAEKHKLIHGKGTTGWIAGDPIVHQWVGFFKRIPSPTQADIYAFRDQLKSLCGGDITSADLINWPIPK